jgi:hypothetical protein
MNSAEPLELEPADRPRPPAVDISPPKFNWEKVEWFDLQWAHRFGTVALFALVAGIAGAITDEGPYGQCLAAAAVISDIGLIGAILAWWTSRRLARRSPEPLGVAIFNLVILLLAVGIYAAGKFGFLHPAVQWITNLFPPAP